MNSISQNLKNVLKNRIKILITPVLYQLVDSLIDSFSFDNSNYSNYFYLFSDVLETTRQFIKSVIISTFEEIDNNFKNISQRKSRYYINKSNVSRTLITIVGEITFSRTYYISKFSKNSFLYLDTALDLLNLITMALSLKLLLLIML